MSVIKTLGSALAVMLLATTSTYALSVTNRDTAGHTVYVLQGDQQSEYDLPAGESVDATCDESCTVRIAGIEGELSAQGADKLIIQNGALQREEQ